MQKPTIEATFRSSGGRTVTVWPNTVSVRPVSRPNSTPHAPWTRVFRVTPSERAVLSAVAVSSSESSTTTSCGRTVVAGAAGASKVCV